MFHVKEKVFAFIMTNRTQVNPHLHRPDHYKGWHYYKEQK